MAKGKFGDQRWAMGLFRAWRLGKSYPQVIHRLSTTIRKNAKIWLEHDFCQQNAKWL